LFGKGDFRGLYFEIEQRIKDCAKICGSVDDILNRIRAFLYETVTGARLTLAQWMRRFVKGHPAYSDNSILSKEVIDDLLIRLHKISIGAIEDENFKNIFPVDTKMTEAGCG
jgi:hypothetical protein